MRSQWLTRHQATVAIVSKTHISRCGRGGSGAAIRGGASGGGVAWFRAGRNRRLGRRLRGVLVRGVRDRAMDWRCGSRGRRTGGGPKIFGGRGGGGWFLDN